MLEVWENEELKTDQHPVRMFRAPVSLAHTFSVDSNQHIFIVFPTNIRVQNVVYAMEEVLASRRGRNIHVERHIGTTRCVFCWRSLCRTKTVGWAIWLFHDFATSEKPSGNWKAVNCFHISFSISLPFLVLLNLEIPHCIQLHSPLKVSHSFHHT